MTDIPLSEPYSKFLFNEVQKINQAIWFHFPKFYQEWLEDLLEKLAQPDCNWKKIDTRQGLVHILAKSLIIRFNDLDILTVMNDWLKKDK